MFLFVFLILTKKVKEGVILYAFAAYVYITWVLIHVAFYINTHSAALRVVVVLCATQICTLLDTLQ